MKTRDAVASEDTGTVLAFPAKSRSRREFVERKQDCDAVPEILSRCLAPKTFTDARGALDLPVPATGHCEYWHASTSHDHFGIRISAKTRKGTIRRVWIVRFKDGAEWTKRNVTEATMATYMEAHERASRLHRRGAVKDGPCPTLREAYDAHLELNAGRLSPDTIKGYTKRMKTVEDWWNRHLDQFTSQNLKDRFALIKANAAVTQRKRGRPADDKNGRAAAVAVMRLLRCLFTAAHVDGHLIRNPMAGLVKAKVFDRGERVGRPLTSEEFPKFWHWLHTRCHAAARDYILVGLFSAMRESVLQSLSWENYNPRTHTYTLQADQRGNKRRTTIAMPLPDYLVKSVLEPRFKSPTKHKTWIVPSMRYPDHPTKCVRGMLSSLRGVIGFVPSDHDLRRTAATLCQRATGDSLLVQRLLTHCLESAESGEQTTAGYITTELKQLKAAMDAMVAQALKEVGQAYAEHPNDFVNSVPFGKATTLSQRAPLSVAEATPPDVLTEFDIPAEWKLLD